MDDDDPDDCTSNIGTEGMTPDNADLLLPSDNLNVSFEDLHPDPVNTFRLWQIFLDRVNPLTKIIHVPTLQPYVMEAANDMKNIPPNYQALLFAVLLMGACSLTEEEHKQMIGKPRDGMIKNLATGLKRALIKFDFVRNYDMAALQSLVLFLVSATMKRTNDPGLTILACPPRSLRQTCGLGALWCGGSNSPEDGLSPGWRPAWPAAV